MPLRYLFGPVPPDYADQCLSGPRQRGECLTFSYMAGADLTVAPGGTWEGLCARLPEGWRPDLVVLYLPYTIVPACLWSAPVPLVGLALDWNFLWHPYRRLVPRCDLVLTDRPGVETLAREGLTHAWPASLFGCRREFLEGPWPEGPRDLDVVFVGNLHPAQQRERLPWLARLARLGERWRVALATGVFGAEYRGLLGRARIAFNRSIRGECNQRTFEAVAAGTLLFQEADNREVPDYFRDRLECVYYDADNLEELLEYYLTHEKERRAIAEAARQRLPQCGFEALWGEQLARLEREWPWLLERQDRRLGTLGRGVPPTFRSPLGFLDRAWQTYGSYDEADPTLIRDLQDALTQDPTAALLHNALGLAATLAKQGQGPTTPELAEPALEYFRRAVEADPAYVMAGLNLAEALLRCGRAPEAAAHARRALETLEVPAGLDAATLVSPHFPPAFDLFRVEWERAAWAHAGQPKGEVQAKRDLLRWRLHTLLADVTGALEHAQQAVAARPDLSSTRASLGHALLRAGRHPEAADHLRRALEGNPFDPGAAQAMFEVLGTLGDPDGQRRLARERRLLAQAAPQLVPPEPWFDNGGSPAAPAVGQSKTLPLTLDDLRRYRQGGRMTDPSRDPFGIVWEGLMLAQASYAVVNREICQRLLERGHELALLALDARDASNLPMMPALPLLAERFHRPLSRPADVNVRHFWPPTFAPPPAGHLVLMQPWEYGSLPRAWLGPILEEVDEVWAYTHYVRDCYLKSGVPADRVHVVPLGVDPARFCPQAPPLPLRTGKRFKFLFVGGTIARKGFDLLLTAYAQSFTATDDVCLVVKDMGVGTFYRGQTAEAEIARLQARPGAPEIEYLDRPLSDGELVGLYSACDCLVHPYRGEGFGLPIAEAMACGLPVIVTGYGAALDFCNEENAYLLPAQVVRFPHRRVGEMETVDYPWLAEADLDALQQCLRHVVAHPAEARAKGQAGSAHIRAHFTWDHAVDVVEQRVADLRRRPIRRLARVAMRRAETALPAQPKAGRQRVSLSMIVKNEGANLPACLESVADLVDEIIVADTGSTDRTKEVAARFGARVVDFAWVDSFAAARNESLRHCTGDWVFWLDADDRLDEENRQRLRTLLAGLKDENAAYAMKCLCLPEHDTGAATVVDHVRLFRNHPDLRWEYRVHEQILGSLRRLGAEVRGCDVVIHHCGYQDATLRARKLQRDLRLLRLEDRERPDDPFILFNLGSVLSELGQPAEALALFQRSLERSDPRDSIVRKLYALIVGCQRQLGWEREALAACRDGLGHCPDDVELLYTHAKLLRGQGDLAAAEACLTRLLGTPPASYFASVDPGLRGYRARHLLGEVYRDQGRHAEAEAQWRAVVAEQLGFMPSWLELARLYVAQERWQELEHAGRRLEAAPPWELEGAVLRARGQLARKEFSAAHHLLGEVIARFPQAVSPREVLSHVLLQEGADLIAAEKSLRDVLALDPDNAQAQHNLDVLLRQVTAGTVTG